MTRIALTVAFLAFFLTSGCAAPDDNPQCDGTVDLAVTSIAPPLVAADLVVRGTASTTRNVTIRSLTVGGVQANADSFNYSDWSATVPFAALLAALPSDGSSDDALVPIVASPSCGATGTASVTVRVNRHPEVRVDTLTITPSFPASRTYLPADGSASAVLVVSANPEARGATATLTATGPARFEGASGTASVVLAGDGTTASATVLVTSTGPGTIFLTAAAGTAVAKPVSLVAAAAPKLIPDHATLRPGQSITASVITDSSTQTVSCQVSGKTGISAMEQKDGMAFEVAADDPLTAAVTATITCHDGYGQTSTASYDAEP